MNFITVTALCKCLRVYNQLHAGMWWVSAALSLASRDGSVSSKENGSDSSGEYGSFVPFTCWLQFCFSRCSAIGILVLPLLPLLCNQLWAFFKAPNLLNDSNYV